jgi:hypothetical protein
LKCLFYESSMKKTFIQVVAVAVISQIEPKYVITLVVQMFPCGKYVCRVRTSFPSVYQRDKASGFSKGLQGVIAQQSYAVSPVNNRFLCAFHHRIATASSHVQGAQNRLHVRIFDPRVGSKLPLHEKSVYYSMIFTYGTRCP